jgi:hypothetical protein
MRHTLIIFREAAEKEYLKLKFFSENNIKSDRTPTYVQILKSVDTALTNISQNAYYGDRIQKKYLNKKIINKYGTDKILRVELVGFWRLLYTVRGEEVNIIAFILDFMDHKEYSELFKYSKK